MIDPRTARQHGLLVECDATMDGPRLGSQCETTCREGHLHTVTRMPDGDWIVDPEGVDPRLAAAMEDAWDTAMDATDPAYDSPDVRRIYREVLLAHGYGYVLT